MPDQTTPCGSRTRHTGHPYGDCNEAWCDGEKPPNHYDARHRGRYRAEPDWWPPMLLSAMLGCRHRKDGDPVIVDEPHYPRQRPRLAWRDRSLTNADAGAD